jgi:hypothetical protein
MENYLYPALILLAILAVFTLFDGWKRIPNPFKKNQNINPPAQPQQTPPPPTPTRRSYGRLVARTITVLIFTAITLLLMVVWGTSPAGSEVINTLAALAILIMPTLAFIWFAYEASKSNRQATTVALETFKFVVAGGSLHRILANLTDAGLDRNGRVTTNEKMMVRTYTNPLLEFLRVKLGVYWVSIFYPIHKVYKFKIDKNRLVKGTTLSDGHSIRDLITVEPDVEVDHLLRIIPRPIYVPGVQTNDGFTVDIALMTEHEVTNPRTAVFSLNGQFFPLLDAAMKAAVGDYCNNAKYMQLINTATGKGSGFSGIILTMVADHLERTVGIRPTACYIIQVGIPESDQAVVRATKAKEVAILEGEGVIAAAEAKAKAINTLAKAQANVLKEAVDALVGKGMDMNLAMQQVGRVLAFREISGEGSKITTFVEAGTTAGITIPVSPTPTLTTTTTTP